MAIRFRAAEVHVEINESHAFLGLASGSDDPGHKVLMMRALSDEDALDVLTGETYFEYRDQSTGGYGCISQVTMQPSRLLISCNKRRCPQLPDTEFEIDISAVGESRADLARALEALIDGPRLRSGGR